MSGHTDPLSYRNIRSYQLRVAACLVAEVGGVSYLVEMDETTESANVPEMTETDKSKISEVTGSVEIAETSGRVDDVAEVTDTADATSVTEMVELAEKEDKKGPSKKVFCQQIISASIPRVKTFCLGKDNP